MAYCIYFRKSIKLFITFNWAFIKSFKPKAQWETLKAEYNIIKKEVNLQNFATEKYDKNNAIEMIRRFWMCKNGEKIT